jgi:prepilin-type processing-associated H-X9-DG protein
MTCPSCGARNKRTAARCARCDADLRLVDTRDAPPARLSISRAVSLLVAIAVVAAIVAVWRAERRHDSEMRRQACLWNTRQVDMAVLQYAQDWGGMLPSGATWCDDCQCYMEYRRTFLCPETRSSAGSDYWLNENLAGARVDSIRAPEATVLVFEGANGWDQTGGPGDVVARHRGAAHFGLADGHAAAKEPSALAASAWEP